MADYILTYSRIRFYPITPKSEEINIVDIAHALSLMTRANGHFKHFYSVAQHCINCVKEARARGYSKRVQLGCLLHDASEAYLSDITRPVKQHLGNYKEIENRLQNLIFEHYGLDHINPEENRQIFGIDDAILHHEFLYFKEYPVFEEEPVLLSQPNFSELIFSKVEAKFVELFEQLRGELNEGIA